MSSPNPVLAVTSKVLGTRKTKWRHFKYIQQDDFKELPAEAHAKLKASIINNEFTQPFYAWYDPETKTPYCLDGRHRTRILEELITDGYNVPEFLPATFIDCKDKTEAAKLVLVYSSIYAKITETGFADFVAMYQLDPATLNMIIDIPGLQLPAIPPLIVNSFDDNGIGVKNQFGVTVMCADEINQEKIFNELKELGYECKVVVT